MSLTFQTLKELLIAPHQIIAKKARAKDRNEAVVMLTINWILIALGVSLISSNYSLGPALLVFGIIGTLVLAFFIYLAFTIVEGKGDYTTVLISLTYPFFGVSFSTLVISIISLWSAVVSIFIGIILLLLYFTVGLTGMFRVLKENFKTDLISVWVVISLLILAIVTSIYELAILYTLKAISPGSLMPTLIARLI